MYFVFGNLYFSSRTKEKHLIRFQFSQFRPKLSFKVDTNSFFLVKFKIVNPNNRLLPRILILVTQDYQSDFLT